LDENGSPPELHSISPKALKNFEITRDELGNPKVWLEIDGDYLAEVFSQSPQPFVNLSLELGRLGMDFKVYTTAPVHSEAIDPMTVKQIRSQLTINGKTTPGEYELDGKPLSQEEYDEIWKIWGETHTVRRDSIAYTPIDGYARGGNPRDSLKKMSDLAAKVPEKIIFAAGGNPTSKYGLPNVTGAKAELVQQNKWPENLFLIGFYGIEYGGETLPSGYGADYYVSVDDMDKIKAPSGTSYATPIVGRLVMQYIAEKGLPPTPESVRKVLDAYSVEYPLGDVWDETTGATYRNQMAKVIDIASMTEALHQ